MPTSGQSHDIILVDGAGVRTGWMLQREGADATAMIRKRAQIYTPAGRVGRGLGTGFPVPPAYDLTWEPDDFSFGFGMYRWNPWETHDQQARYALSDGVWADTEGELSLAQAIKEADVLIQNQGFERGVTTGWTATGAAVLAAGTSPNSGDFSLKMTFNAATIAAATQAITNYALLASRTVTFRCVAKKVSGAAVETCRLTLNDGVTTTNGTAVVLTSAYQELSVTKAVGVATQLTLTLERAATTDGASELHWDDIIETDRFGDDGGGGIIKFVYHRGLLYAMNTQCVMVWDTTNLKFSPVRVLANATGAFTDMMSFNGNLFIARGAATAYEYTANPDTLLSNTWTVSALTGNSNRDQNANYFIRVREVAWKVRNPVAGDNSSAAYAADPTVSWAELAVGDTYTNFTGLHAFNDTPVAGKENGLWVFSRNDTQFFDIAPEYETYRSTFHWSRAVAWRSWLYTNADPQALWRYDGVNMQEIGFLLSAPQFDDITARVLALGHNSMRLFALVDTTAANNSVDEKTWLCSIQEIRIGPTMHWVIHTEHQLTLGDVNQALCFDSNTLYAGGTIRRAVETKSMAAVYRLVQPTLGTPSHGRSQDLRFSGTLITPYWDGGYPDANKALRQLIQRLSDMSATETVKTEIQINEDTAWTNLQTFNASGIKTISIETQADTKKAAFRCRFRLTLAAGSSTTAPRTYPTTSPKVKLPFILHTSLMPTRNNEIELKVLVADNLPTLSGVETQTAAQLLDIINGYIDNATFPVTLEEDLDGNGTIKSYRIVINAVTQTEQFESPERGRVFVYTIQAVEVPV